MIKKIRASLFLKIFFTTSAMLFFASALTYGLLAWLMPRTYSNRLSDSLDIQARELIAKLEQVPFRDSGGLFDQFLQNMDISYVELYGSDGAPVPLPSGNADVSYNGEPPSDHTSAFYNGATTSESTEISCDVAAIADENSAVYTDPDVPIVSNSYYFSFADDKSVYMLYIAGAAGQIAQLRQTIRQILPLLSVLILLAALFLALLYARMITRPITRISRMAQKMSDLQWEWSSTETRSDELGVLEKSLHTLSEKLAATISGLQNANKKLAEDIEHEKVLEQARLDFFSAVSHELKTPVTIVKGQLEGMLLGIGVYKDHEKYLARALEITGTLETMVQELLTVSRLETSDAHFQTDHFDCVAVIRDYLEETEDWIARKKLRIFCEMPAAAYIDGNKILMEKVFSNLIGNAVKYSPDRAKVRISLCPVPGSCTFSIENTGVCIPEDRLPRLFEAFFRMDPSRNRKTGGSGLGLYIVQKILGLHGSHCTVHNTDEGVQFSFTL
ncbi:MAG TPA: two-component sensor histidine kinase [Lachnospiraceae bacterium]|nr:two-component sensor histidine kinase [Lachnospiraceae bacterium]